MGASEQDDLSALEKMDLDNKQGDDQMYNQFNNIGGNANVNLSLKA